MSIRLLHQIFSATAAQPIALFFASLLLASCGGGGGGDPGGFTGGQDTLNVELTADKYRLPANVTYEGPDTEGPFMSNFTIRVFDERDRLFPASSITLSLDPVSNGALYYLDGDPDHEDEDGNPLAFRRMVFEDTDGIGTGHFLALANTGTVRLTASVIDDASGYSQSAEIFIEVYDDVDRTLSSLAFSGAYFNAVISGVAFGDGDDVILNGVYRRVLSVIALTEDGIPVRPNTEIRFFLIDNPVVGFPVDGAGSFLIAGNNGDPLEGGQFFTAANGQFRSLGVLPRDRLILDGNFTFLPDNFDLSGFFTVASVASESQLTITDSPMFPSNRAGDNGPTVPYVIGRAEYSNILSRALTDVTGTATTILTYPAAAVGRTAILGACTVDRSVCTIYYPCDAAGQNCSRTLLPVANGVDMRFTSSATTLGPNSSTPVQFCLSDRNFNPIPVQPIRYSIPGGLGSAVVTIDGTAELTGALSTGSDGCVTTVIETSGQAPGTESILLTFTSPGVDPETPLEIEILGPGAGKLTGSTSCEGVSAILLARSCRNAAIQTIGDCSEDSQCSETVQPASCAPYFVDGNDIPGPDTFSETSLIGLPPATCTTNLFLQDDRGGPIPGVTITVAASEFVGGVTFDPALNAVAGLTDENGENVVTTVHAAGDSTSITFEAGGAEYKFDLDLSL